MVAETFRLERFMWRVVLKNTLNTRNKHVTNQMHEVTGSILLHPDWHFFLNNINMKIDAIFANTDPRFNICFYNISDRN